MPEGGGDLDVSVWPLGKFKVDEESDGSYRVAWEQSPTILIREVFDSVLGVAPATAPGEKAVKCEVVTPKQLEDGRGADAGVPEVREALPSDEEPREAKEVLQQPVRKLLLHEAVPEKDAEEGHHPEGGPVCGA